MWMSFIKKNANLIPIPSMVETKTAPFFASLVDSTVKKLLSFSFPIKT